MEFIELKNGVKMPKLGYGVYQVSQEECERCVSDALEVGYRHEAQPCKQHLPNQGRHES